MIKILKKSYFIIIPLVLTALMLGFKLIHFGTVDDVLLYDMVTSYKTNAHSEQVFFVSIIFGYILRFLYGVLPAVNWFGVMYLAAYNLAYITLFKIVEKHGSNVAFISVLSGLHIYFLMRISFTTNAFILVCTSVLWLFDSVEKLEKKSVGNIIYGFLLMLAGFGMRRDATLFCIVLLFVPTFVLAIVKKQKSVAVIAAILVLLTVSNYSMEAVQTAYKAAIPTETYYNEFQPYRSAASDGGKISYKRHKELFDEAGLSSNDIKIYKRYIYGDKEAYSGEKLKAIIKSRDFKDKYNTDVKDIIKRILKADEYILNYFYYIAAVALILFILYRKKRLELFSSSVFIAAAEVYLFLRRRGVTRVTFPLAMLGIIILMYTVIGEENPFGFIKNKKTAKRITLAVCAVVLAGTAILSAGCVKTYIPRFGTYDKVLEYIENDEEHVYLSIPKTRDRIIDRHLTVLTKDYNVVPMSVVCGDWYIYTYYYYDMLDRLGLEEYSDKAINAFLDDKVLVASFDKKMPDEFVKFYNEHYHYYVTYREIREFKSGLVIYDFDIIEQ